MIRDFRLLLVASMALAVTLLAGCADHSYLKDAYAVGQSFKLVQEGEKAYLTHGNPTKEAAAAIDEADAKATSVVSGLIDAAIDVEKPDPTMEAAGLSAAEVKQSKADAFTSLLDLAKGAIAKVKTAFQ